MQSIKQSIRANQIGKQLTPRNNFVPRIRTDKTIQARDMRGKSKTGKRRKEIRFCSWSEVENTVLFEWNGRLMDEM